MSLGLLLIFINCSDELVINSNFSFKDSIILFFTLFFIACEQEEFLTKTNKKDIVSQTRGVQTQGTTKAVGTKYAKNEDFIVNVLGTKAGTTYNAGQIYGIRQLLEAGMTLSLIHI